MQKGELTKHCAGKLCKTGDFRQDRPALSGTARENPGRSKTGVLRNREESYIIKYNSNQFPGGIPAGRMAGCIPAEQKSEGRMCAGKD